MDETTFMALLVLTGGGLVLVSLYALWLQFQKWQIQKVLQMMNPWTDGSSQSGSGLGGVFRTIWVVVVVVLVGLVLLG